MSEGTGSNGTTRLNLVRVQERQAQLMGRVDALENEVAALQATQANNHRDLLVELRVLQTRVGLLATGIGTFAGVVSSLAVRFIT